MMIALTTLDTNSTRFFTLGQNESMPNKYFTVKTLSETESRILHELEGYIVR